MKVLLWKYYSKASGMIGEILDPCKGISGWEYMGEEFYLGP